MTERLLIVWPPGASVRQGAGPGGRWPIFRGGFQDGRVNAGAAFVLGRHGWSCVRAAPSLSWFVGTPLENIRHWLQGEARKRGWRYEWARRFEVA
jgi:hypothetical protein